MNRINVRLVFCFHFIEYDHIVMICDPPRSGLHKDIIVNCRKCNAITELIYVSCNPTGSFIDNARNLLRYVFIHRAVVFSNRSSSSWNSLYCH